MFFTAARRGEFNELRRLAGQNPDLVTAPDPDCFNYRLINYGAWRNRKDYIDLALEHGADLNQPCEFWAGDWTALQHALNYGHPDLAAYLVERGARIDVHAAAGLARLDLLREVLDRDPEHVHKRGGDGMTPLHFASTPAVVDLLLERGAHLEARDVDHYSTAAQWAAGNRPEVARYLVSRGAVTDIFMACAIPDLDLVRSLIRENPEVIRERVSVERFPPPAEHPDTRSIYFFNPAMGPQATPLHVAAVKDAPRLIELLVECGLEVDVRGAYDEATPLHLAAWNGSLRAIERLLQLGAVIDAPSGPQHRNTPLGWAIVSGNLEAIRCLLERNAQIEPIHLKEAATGTEGRFQEFSDASLEQRQKIQEILETR